MPIECFDPQGLPTPEVHRQVAVATGSRTVFLAGQVARDAEGNPVAAGDFAGQVEQALRNVVIGVEAAGGSFADVAKLRKTSSVSSCRCQTNSPSSSRP